MHERQLTSPTLLLVGGCELLVILVLFFLVILVSAAVNFACTHVLRARGGGRRDRPAFADGKVERHLLQGPCIIGSVAAKGQTRTWCLRALARVDKSFRVVVLELELSAALKVLAKCGAVALDANKAARRRDLLRQEGVFDREHPGASWPRSGDERKLGNRGVGWLVKECNLELALGLALAQLELLLHGKEVGDRDLA